MKPALKYSSDVSCDDFNSFPSKSDLIDFKTNSDVVSQTLNVDHRISQNFLKPENPKQSKTSSNFEAEKVNPSFNVNFSLQNINVLGEKYLKNSEDDKTAPLKFLSKKDCKLKSGTILRRTPRLTTFVKSYSDNIVNFTSEKKLPGKKKCNSLSFCVLNVGGLRSKMKSEDFFDFVNDYDIIGLLEVKMDKNDLDSIKTEFINFDIFCNIDKEYSVKPRGGIVLLVKKNLVPFVHIFPSEQNLALFFQIKAEFINSSKDLICGCTYIPPYTSLYNDKNSFENLEAEIIELPGLAQSDLVILGDFNAKTKTEKDFIDFDKYDIFSESEEPFSKGCPLNRANRDTHDLDLQGKKLIDFCKTLNLRIVNGRVGADEGIGQFTTRNNSVVDYCLAPAHFFSNFLSFEIHEYNPLISDVHCPITFELEANINKDVENFKNFTKPHSKWDPTKADIYVTNFKQMNLVDIENKVTKLSIEPSPESLNDTISSINRIFKQTKLTTFPPKKVKLKKKKTLV